jgi:uncharacterized membrane protein YebE (DUF533 family)
MKQRMNRWITVGALGVMSVGSMGIMEGTAQAKKSTIAKYGAIAGAALAGYGLVKGNGRAATVGAVAGVGSYYLYRHYKKEEDRRQQWYKRQYGSDWRRHYKPRPKPHQKSAEERREDWYRNRYGNDWKRHYNPSH